MGEILQELRSLLRNKASNATEEKRSTIEQNSTLPEEPTMPHEMEIENNMMETTQTSQEEP